MQLPKQHLNTALAQPRSRSGQSGFSLIEVMVSMTIFLIATGAMYGLMDIASKSRTTTSQRAELLKSARTAMLVIGRDAFNAGYKYPVYSVLVSDNKVGSLLNVAPDADGTRDTLPAIVAGRLRNANTLSNHSTDQVSFVFQDGNFNLDADIVSQALSVNAPTLNMSLGLDEVVPISGDVTACRAKDIMIITGRTSTTIGVVTGIVGSSVQFANGDVLGINTPLATDNPMHNIQAPTSMRRVNLITYLVLPNGKIHKSCAPLGDKRLSTSPAASSEYAQTA